MTTSKNDKNPRTTGRPTLNEVARLAGVSPITASRALRGISSVATDLAEKVRQAADELNYVVNPAARALASAQSHSVVVLVPSLSNLLFIDTLEAIHEVLRPKGFEVLIGNYHYSRDEEENLLRNYMAYQPRGLLLTGFDRTESSRRMIEASNTPCVYMMELDAGAGLNCVGFSQLKAGETAAQHLISRGRRHLAYIGAQLDQRTLLRGEGYRRALQEAGLYNPDLEVLTPALLPWAWAASCSCNYWPLTRKWTRFFSATTTLPMAPCWKLPAPGSKSPNKSPSWALTTCHLRNLWCRA